MYKCFPVSASSVGNLICKSRVTNIRGVADKSYTANEYRLFELVQFEPKFLVREWSVDENLKPRFVCGISDDEIEYPYTLHWVDITQHIKEYGLEKTLDLIKEIKNNAGRINPSKRKFIIWNKPPVTSPMIDHGHD